MTSTLVERLRKYADMDAFRDRSTFSQAADEIERLREALERIAKTATDVGSELSMTDEEWRDYWSDKCGVHWNIARSALRPGEG